MVDGPEGPSLLWVNHFAVLPSDGGGTRHFEVGRELAQRGWRVTVAASDFNLHSRAFTRRADASERSVKTECVDGVEFVWLWAAPYLTNDWRRARNWVTFAWSLLRYRPAAHPDIIIGSSPHLLAALGAEFLARWWRIPFVLEVRDLWPESLVAAGGRKGPAYYVFAVLARYLYRRARRIVVLSRGAAAHLKRLGVAPERLAYVPNGVDLDAFRPMERAKEETMRFVYAGAHGPANGLEVVLDAAEQLLDDRRLRIVLVGDGAVKERLVNSARERALTNVEFRPPVPKREMPELLASCHAGLMVLRDAELFHNAVSPNKLFEYLGAGLPVVCNVPGEVASMLRDARGGVQAADSGAAALAAAIRQVASATPSERIETGRSGRAWVAREHARPVLGERLDSVLRSLLD